MSWVLSNETIAEMYEDHAPAMFRTACRIVFSAPAAEELVHEAFYAFTRAARAGRIDPEGNRTAYLYKILVNHAYNLLDKRENRQAAEEHAPIAMGARYSATAHAVRDALGTLPETYRIPLVLSVFQDIKAPEIAALLGLSKATVRKRLQRGREKLDEALSDSFFNDD